MPYFTPEAVRRIARAVRKVERTRPAGTRYRAQPPRGRPTGQLLAATVIREGSPPLTSSGDILNFNAELYDSHSFWSPAAPTKITFAEAGKGDYLVTWFAEFEADDFASTDPFVYQPFTLAGLVNGTTEYGKVSGGFYQLKFPRGYELWQLLQAGDSGTGLAIYDGLDLGDTGVYVTDGGQDAINHAIADMQQFESFIEAYCDHENEDYHTQVNEHYIWLQSAFIFSVESLSDYLELQAVWSTSIVTRVLYHNLELSIVKINAAGAYTSPEREVPEDD